MRPREGGVGPREAALAKAAPQGRRREDGQAEGRGREGHPARRAREREQQQGHHEAVRRREVPARRGVQGHNATKSTLRTEPLPKPSGDDLAPAPRTSTKRSRSTSTRPDGTFDDDVARELDELFRCTRTGEVRAVRAELYEQLSRIYDHFEGKRVELVSGFRFAERNSSRHFHASAMDIRIPGVSIDEMYKFAESLDARRHGHRHLPDQSASSTSTSARRASRATAGPTGRAGSGKKARSRRSRPARTQPARKPTRRDAIGGRHGDIPELHGRRGRGAARPARLPRLRQQRARPLEAQPRAGREAPERLRLRARRPAGGHEPRRSSSTAPALVDTAATRAPGAPESSATTNVYVMPDGIAGWEKAKQPVEVG